ncbi:hypothetical protein Daus18300_002210 [Diaporthe australafricana]|uniref:AAA+ ATPase domain-containing protein n=1 Tax=Diaporthe australafricana TaxID=127596 RepID=A0ABR3XRX7_9PEZI
MAELNEENTYEEGRSLPFSKPSSSSEDSDHSPSSSSIRKKDIRVATKKREEAERAKAEAFENLRRAKISDLERKNFHSHAGIIYVSDEFWLQLWQASGPCHLYVSLQNLDKASSQRSQLAGYLPDQGPPNSQSVPTSLPPRIKIVNKILHSDMADAAGLKEQFPDPNSLSRNHVAPFRDIIPFETTFRQRHVEAEKMFSDMATEEPDHPAVVRQEIDWVPENVSVSNRHYTLVRVEDTDLDDKFARARILRDGYRALIHLLDHELSNLVQDWRRIQAGTIENLPFLHLWHFFKPGQEILANDGKLQAYRVLQVTGGRKLMNWGTNTDEVNKKVTQKAKISNLRIDCFHLDFDGQEFGPIPVTIDIKPYEGSKAIRQLAAYPLTLATDPHLPWKLTERGKKFEQMVEASHRKYNGLSLRGKEPFDNVEEIDGDVMVDFKLAYRANEPLRRIDMPKFHGGVIDDPTQEDETENNDSDGHLSLAFDRGRGGRDQWIQWTRQTDLLEKRLPGYCLMDRTLRSYIDPLDIDLINPVQHISADLADGFDKLVLPPGHKDIVRALVKTHAKKLDGTEAKTPINTQREFDIVKGKGKGLIILLHGAPGVGKTSTAECVAANTGKPLFPITIGDIGGDSAQQVEQNLEKYFDFARNWNCVLLLDEADVFLSTRVAGNITQNSLVSVFLRALEYYSGVLILTTNRVGSFDEAIKSRVHCALYYPPLDKDQTIRVWQMNLDSLEERNANPERSQRIQYERKEIEEFARHHWKKGKHSNRWNGRQIKNAFQTAVALADWDNLTYTDGVGNPNGTILKAEHFKKVAVASEHFDMYLERTRTTDQQRAREDMYREDNVGSRIYERSESDEETESEEEESKKKKKKPKKTSDKKGKSSKGKKRSKSKKQVEQESDEESEEESQSEKETS